MVGAYFFRCGAHSSPPQHPLGCAGDLAVGMLLGSGAHWGAGTGVGGILSLGPAGRFPKQPWVLVTVACEGVALPVGYPLWANRCLRLPTGPARARGPRTAMLQGGCRLCTHVWVCTCSLTRLCSCIQGVVQAHATHVHTQHTFTGLATCAPTRARACVLQ